MLQQCEHGVNYMVGCSIIGTDYEVCRICESHVNLKTTVHNALQSIWRSGDMLQLEQLIVNFGYNIITILYLDPCSTP